MNFTFYKAIIGIYIIFCFNSCKEQSTIEDCKTGIKNAKSNLNTYYKSNDLTLLNGALSYTEQAMLCKDTRSQAVELKTSLLILLKKYKVGYEFTDSLQKGDFNKEYKKNMNYSFFKALYFETNGDKANAHKLYAEAVTYVTHYIETTEKDNQIDQDTFYDLFFMKSKILSKEQIEKEIEVLIKKHPSNKDFFTTLKSSFDDTK